MLEFMLLSASLLFLSGASFVGLLAYRMHKGDRLTQHDSMPVSPIQQHFERYNGRE
tara:strand:- start:6277 stop:6444 length:168 start_codon:yes stop_codon:yes gene_type:complete